MKQQFSILEEGKIIATFNTIEELLANYDKPKPKYKEILDYMNIKCGTNFRYTSKATQRLINARFKEGYTLEDFKKVIDIKSEEWSNTNMEMYLRPITLFGTKFENYINQKGERSNGSNKFSKINTEKKPRELTEAERAAKEELL